MLFIQPSGVDGLKSLYPNCGQMWTGHYKFLHSCEFTPNTGAVRGCITGIRCIRQSHSTHCNPFGYDLISHAAAMWHHTEASRCPAAALRCHRAAALRQPQDTLRCCRQALRLSHCLVHKATWQAKSRGLMVLLHGLCDCCTAVHRTENFRHKQRALYANPQHQIIKNISYVHFRPSAVAQKSG